MVKAAVAAVLEALPCPTGATAARRPQRPCQNRESSGGMEGDAFPVDQRFSVLLVEDDAVTLTYVEQLLRKCGYSGA